MLYIQFLAAAVAPLGTSELFSRKHLIQKTSFVHSVGSNFMHVKEPLHHDVLASARLAFSDFLGNVGKRP